MLLLDFAAPPPLDLDLVVLAVLVEPPLEEDDEEAELDEDVFFLVVVADFAVDLDLEVELFAAAWLEDAVLKQRPMRAARTREGDFVMRPLETGSQRTEFNLLRSFHMSVLQFQ